MSLIDNLNKVFDSRIRLGIMSALMVNTEVNFNELKELLNITDGNLASHLKTLEESMFVKVQKGFIGRKTNTTGRFAVGVSLITAVSLKGHGMQLRRLTGMINFQRKTWFIQRT